MKNRFEYEKRLWSLAIVLLLLVSGLIARIFYLGVIKRNFLLEQSKLRAVREISIPAHRGIIYDRAAQPLAISIPVGSVWVNPKIFQPQPEELKKLAKKLALLPKELQTKLQKHAHQEFLYLKRGCSLELTTQITAMKLPGLFIEKSYKRFYPEGESAAHIVGFTNVDDRGQEGIELAFNEWLSGIAGKQRVVKDRLGNTIETLAILASPKEGKDLTLSIDRRVQYLTFQTLQHAIKEFNAEAGSVVVLSAKTGEILAMANMPSYNPNNRQKVPISHLRNRAVTDLFEPGSTIKPFTVAAGLKSKKYYPNTIIDTNPGVFSVDGHLIYDNNHKNNGALTVSEVLQKSSDIGVAKMALALPDDALLTMLRNFGFGKSTLSGFPGEAHGLLPKSLKKRQFVLATLSFGYSLAVSTLQLARAYLILANQGVDRPISFLKQEHGGVTTRVLEQEYAQQLIAMLETVVQPGGTGTRARVPGYRVAGKTGTAHIASPQGGYYSDRYCVSFAGFAPVSDPELVVVVMIRRPQGKLHHGGSVAAPVFAKIMGGALRILGVKADNEAQIM